ncbi:hypothetical protein D918_00098 [Trichuris suis]|nr:hypothetical protein D918_00098 [Trichuris suis]
MLHLEMFSALIVALCIYSTVDVDARSLQPREKLGDDYIRLLIYEIKKFLHYQAESIDGYYAIIQKLSIEDTIGSPLKLGVVARASNCSQNSVLTVEQVNSPMCSGQSSDVNLMCSGEVNPYKRVLLVTRRGIELKLNCTSSAVKREE